MAAIKGIGFPVSISFTEDESRSDFRPVPRSDTGNGYSDRGELGSWARDDRAPYSQCEGVKFETGSGTPLSDVERGYVVPGIRNDPAYDFFNYRERGSSPRVSDDASMGAPMDSDYEFRARNRRAKGFLTRPYIPNER